MSLLTEFGAAGTYGVRKRHLKIIEFRKLLRTIRYVIYRPISVRYFKIRGRGSMAFTSVGKLSLVRQQ